jgi:hypothetical protein
MLWVGRNTPADEQHTCDLISGNGRVVHRVVLGSRSKLLGFGRNSVYVLRMDEDDLQYVQRYRLPDVARL